MSKPPLAPAELSSSPLLHNQEDPAEQLLNQASTTRYLHSVLQGHGLVAQHIDQAKSPSTGATPEALGEAISGIDLDAPTSLTNALSELERVYLDDAVYFHDRRYAMHLNCPVVIPSLVAEAILSAVNSSLDTWDQASGAVLIERRLIDWTAERIGLTTSADQAEAGANESRPDGIFTSGGTQSNLQALVLARGSALAAMTLKDPEQLNRPLPERLAPLRIYASREAHFSVANAAELLGLGRSAVVPIETDALHRMRAEHLAQMLAADSAAGLKPMAVVATAGTTDFGAIDPLSDAAELARAFGAWFHVDAAYGGGLLVSAQHRQRLAGIECADSVTVDFHKTWFQPVSASAIIVRDSRNMEYIRHHADYLNPRQSGPERFPDQVHKSLQTTRRFDALKLWMTLRTMGAEGIGELLDRVISLAERAGERLEDGPDLKLAAPVQLSTLVLRFQPEGINEEQADLLTVKIREDILSRGTVNVASTKVDGLRHLKLTLLNPHMSDDDVDAILEEIRVTGWRVIGDTHNAGEEREASVRGSHQE